MAIVESVASGNWSDFNTVFGGIQPGPGDVVWIHDHQINADVDIVVGAVEAKHSGARILIGDPQVIGNGGSITIDCDVVDDAPNSAPHDWFFALSNTTGIINFTGHIQPKTWSIIRNNRSIILSTGNGDVTINIFKVSGGSYINDWHIFDLATRNHVGIEASSTFSGTIIIEEAVANQFSHNTYCHPVLINGPCTVNISKAFGGFSVTNDPTQASFSRGAALLCRNQFAVVNVNECFAAAGVGVSSAIRIDAGTATIKHCYGPSSASANGVITTSTGNPPTVTIENAYGTGFGYAVQPWTESPANVRILNAVGPRAVLCTPTRLATIDNIDATQGFPITGPFRLYNSLAPLKVLDENGDDLFLANPVLLGDVPEQVDVRYNTSYALGNRLGSMHVPPKNMVAFPTPVDDGIGEAAITQESIREAVGLDGPNLDFKLSAIPWVTNEAVPVTFTATSDYPEEDTPVTGVILRILGRTFATGPGGSVTIPLEPSAEPHVAKIFVNQIYQSVADIEVTVGQDPITVPIHLSLRPGLTPSPDQLIETLLSVTDQMGDPLPEGTITANVVGYPIFSGSTLVVNTPQSRMLNPGGAASMPLYRGLTYRFVVRVGQTIAVDEVRTLPEAGESFNVALETNL